MSLFQRPVVLLHSPTLHPVWLGGQFCVPKHSAAAGVKAKKKQALEKKMARKVHHQHWNEADAPGSPAAFGCWIDKMVEEIESTGDSAKRKEWKQNSAVNHTSAAGTHEVKEHNVTQHSPTILWMQ